MSRVSAVFSLTEASRSEAVAWATRFTVPHIEAVHLHLAKAKDLERFLREQIEPSLAESRYVLLASAEALRLVQLTAESCLVVSADFCNTTLNYRRVKGGGKNQMLAKAVGLAKSLKPRVLDATAGLGRDAFILAGLGCSVRMLERVPEVRALLESGLDKAAAQLAALPVGLSDALWRLSLEAGDAIQSLDTIVANDHPDVVYLDPMFPPRQKSALVKKEMRIFHDLVGIDDDAGRLFDAAMACGAKRVVVKRPRIAPTLGNASPSFVLSGKSNRYDVYVR
ncbi:MAG: SAM-dependent methyltransferase [Puniceicoccaceae bacterium]|nr:MAG: SAM-dependent methyltransferase [Puniceicoccaceae bacterium]